MKGTETLGTNENVEEEIKTFFFDTYALFEIIGGNPKYNKYLNCNILTTIFNIAELNYNLKKDMEKNKADNYTKQYYDFAVEVTLEDIKNAMDLKTKRRNLSIPDAVGYIVAKRHNAKFLTGDEDFRDMENVELVKK